jgi:hypothetical protein
VRRDLWQRPGKKRPVPSTLAARSLDAPLRIPAPGAQPRVFDLGAEYRDDRGALDEEYWLFHPRLQFLKSARRGGRLLDFGAGDGGAVFWRDWMPPHRPDLLMTAIDLRKGAHFDRYQDYEVVDVSKQPSRFSDGAFDYVLAANVMEYIPNVVATADELGRLTCGGGRVYVEFPSPSSTQFPTLTTLRSVGIASNPLNFYDDQDHVHLLDERRVEALFAPRGFRRIGGGSVVNDRLAPEMIAHGFHRRDMEILSSGLRLAYAFSSFVVLEKAR